MNYRCISNAVVSVILLMIMGLVHAGTVFEDFRYSDPNDLIPETVFEDFEYADANDFKWIENNGNAIITLTASDSNDFHQVMNYAYSCGTKPYATEAYTIFPAAQDWSMCDTFSMWVKGKVSSQSLEDMYVVLYTATDPNDSMTHADLEELGSARFYKVTQLPGWTYWRADIDFRFESLKAVWGIGIGMFPVSYGSGVIQIDHLARGYTGLGGVIDNFEMYADANDLPQYVAPGTANCTLALDDVEVLNGNHAMKIAYNNGKDPWWTKVMFTKNIKHLGYNWNALGYNSLTLNFKVTDPEGYLKIILFDKGGTNRASYIYNGGARVPAGDWTRWDIDLRSVLATNPTALDEVARVDIYLLPLNDGYGYGTGVMYVDDFHVNVCGLESDLCNDDCYVNMSDFSVLAGQWGRTDCAAPDYCQGADLLIGGERDEKVDLSDAAVMISEWLKCELLFEDDCYL